MTQQNRNPFCSNGHEQPVNGSKFCIYCGVTLGASAPNLSPAQNAGYPPPTVRSNGPQNMPPQDGHYVGARPPQPTQKVCNTCGGNGAGLDAKRVICPECRWLRPLVPGFQVDSSAFAWAADAKAMNALKAMTPLNAAAKAVSEKVGRRWIEVTFNGVRLGEKQLPHVYGQAVRAARILGMGRMPDIYLSGERPWDMLTFGTERDSFVVVGSAMAGNFQGVDMLFLLARELGHCKSGHALWKTVIRFFLGEQGPQKGFMAGGIFNALMSPSALIGGAIEMPLLAWARQAEITADRAGLLTVGSLDIARRVLLAWTMKSSLMVRQMNIDTWLEQQAADDGDILRLSELTVTSTPYIGPRLKLLTQYAESPELKHYLKIIGDTIRKAAPPKPASEKQNDATIRVKCAGCGTGMRVPQKALQGKMELPVRCPDAKCGVVTMLKKSTRPAAEQRKPSRMEEMNYGD